MQLQLLDLQALDTRLGRLAHRRRNLPEQAAAEQLGAQSIAVDGDLVSARTQVSDVTRELRKAESDVEQVRNRLERDRSRLEACQVGSPRELESLQHEVESLGTRQGALEEIELEIMERQEAGAKLVSELEARRAELADALARAERDRDAAYAQLDGEHAELAADRDRTAGRISEELVALYDKLRAQYDGVGAAALRQGRCEGCRMELNTSDLARIADAPPDAVLRCEDCRRILVRTPESGL